MKHTVCINGLGKTSSLTMMRDLRSQMSAKGQLCKQGFLKIGRLRSSMVILFCTTSKEITA